MFRAFLPGYLSSGSISASALLPESCEAWLDFPEGSVLGEFSLQMRSNQAFQANLDLPATYIGDQCVPAIMVAIGQGQYSYPVRLRLSIKDEPFAELLEEATLVASTYSEEFSFVGFQCTGLGVVPTNGKISLEQLIAKTFVGDLKLEMLAALEGNACDQELRPTICDCADAEGIDAQLAVSQTPLMTIAIAQTSESEATLSRQGEQALIETRCLAEIEELRANDLEIVPQNLSEECWTIPQLANDANFKAGRASFSSIRALE